ELLESYHLIEDTHYTHFLECILIHDHVFFFFNHPAPTLLYTLSLHDALPICAGAHRIERLQAGDDLAGRKGGDLEFSVGRFGDRSEEHTSELQSQSNLVCRLLLEKKNHSLSSRLSVNCKNAYFFAWLLMTCIV